MSGARCGVSVLKNKPDHIAYTIDLFNRGCLSETPPNLVLFEAKKVGDAIASARLFNEEQN